MLLLINPTTIFENISERRNGHMEILLKKKWYLGFFAVLLSVLLTGTQVEAQKKIKIGVMGPMKFTRGEHAWYGAQLAAEEINAAGGIMIKGEKHLIELIKADTNEFVSIPDAVSTTERLITVDKVNFLVGGSRTEACLAQQEVMADHKVIWGNSGGIAHPEPRIRIAKNYDRYKYWFSGNPNSIYVGKNLFAIVNMAAIKIREELGITTPRVALLMEKAKWVDPIVEAAEGSLPKMGMEVVGVWRPSPMATDMTAELTAIKNAGAHIIFHIMSGGTNGVAVGKGWGELKIPAALIGFNTEAQHRKYWEATGNMCNYEAIFHVFGRVKLSGKTIPFFDKFVARFKEWPEQDAANYDVIFILKEAIERAGTLQADAVITEIEKTDTSGVLGRLVYYPKKDWVEVPHRAHEPKWGPGEVTFVGLQWLDGKLVGIWPDGRPVMGDEKWTGLKYEGTVDYKLPPWMIKHWKK
jgi:branched-chain amino acid transport system substrate-binding protein